MVPWKRGLVLGLVGLLVVSPVLARTCTEPRSSTVAARKASVPLADARPLADAELAAIGGEVSWIVAAFEAGIAAGAVLLGRAAARVFSNR